MQVRTRLYSCTFKLNFFLAVKSHHNYTYIDLYCDGGDLKAKSSFLEQQGMHSVVKCLVSENNFSLACMRMHMHE